LSKIAYGTLQSFSEQQLVDCSTSYGNNACNGGLMNNAFKYVKDKGITSESAYPYTGVKATCKATTGSFKISGYTNASGCPTLANAVVGRPVSVAVDASNWSTYKSGTLSNCGVQLNHGVLLVGLTDAYWLVKNSWASSWGLSGYIQLARGNTCGICNQASYPNK
jgi:C1A family cysteine protease